ncbi:MAG: hypothetical protein M3O28_11300, partial [Actinomycetota bacterium]|nr:hypothetical protein [Actinomycetota bacterium]
MINRTSRHGGALASAANADGVSRASRSPRLSARPLVTFYDRIALNAVMATITSVLTMVSGAILVLFASGTTAQGATPHLSTISKTGTDTTTHSTATSGGAAGSANAGDTINWTLNYANTTSSTAAVKLTDTIDPKLTLNTNSIKVPPGFTSSTTSGPPQSLAVTGTSVPGSTGAAGPLSPQTPVLAQTSKGDGYNALFFGSNVYTVNHHSGSPADYLFCAQKVSGAPCAGFPANGDNTYVSTTANMP